MQKAEKKLGCLKGIGRANTPCVGYISGSVNDATMPNGGRKQVSIIDQKMTFWATNDYDVTVFPEDIVGCSVTGIGVDMKHTVATTEKNSQGSNRKANQFGDVLTLTFADGTSGKLEVTEFCAFSDEVLIRPDLNPRIKVPTEADWRLWNTWLTSGTYYPVVAGWLKPDGTKDEHYDDLLCPDTYLPDVVRLMKKAYASNKINAIKEMANAVKLRNKITDVTEALDLHTRFEGFSTVFGNDNHSYSILKGAYIDVGDKSVRYIRLEK